MFGLGVGSSSTVTCRVLVLTFIKPPEVCTCSRFHFRPRSLPNSSYSSPSRCREVHLGNMSSDNGSGSAVSLGEWQGWGPTSSVPSLVTEIIEEMKVLENNVDAQMSFGGPRGKLKIGIGRLQGDFKVLEDKKHRATYQSLGDPEKKLQFFSARQIACRLLGSRGYLCQKCWLPNEDCMCLKIKPCTLWHGMRLWVYMHPKDFLRQNNTGKLLWQIFGVHAATLCLFGIPEQEELMWNSFKLAGKTKVWCLYPNKNDSTKSVHDSFTEELRSLECPSIRKNNEEVLNFVLIDGTWSNSAAMFKRLKDRSEILWEDDLSCISLNVGASSMHRLRPQPSWDRTCTAAAAVGLLEEMHLLPRFSSHGLGAHADAIDEGIEILLEALTARRLRMGRSITRKERHKRDIC